MIMPPRRPPLVRVKCLLWRKMPLPARRSRAGYHACSIGRV